MDNIVIIIQILCAVYSNTTMFSRDILPVATPITDNITQPFGVVGVLPVATPVGCPVVIYVIGDVEPIQPVLENSLTNTECETNTDSETDSCECGYEDTDEEYNSDGEYICFEDREDFDD